MPSKASASSVQNSAFKITPGKGKAPCGELIEYIGGKKPVALGKVKYHVKYWLEPKGDGKTVNLGNAKLKADSLDLYGDVEGLGRFSLSYKLDGRKGLVVSCKFKSSSKKTLKIGFFFWAFEAPAKADSLRYVPGCYSGYTMGKDSFLFRFDYSDAKGLTQMAPAVDNYHVPEGTVSVTDQYLVMSFPPSYMDGVAEVKPGATVSGCFRIERRAEHIWDPSLKKYDLKLMGKAANKPLKPRYPVSKYVANWEKYTQDPVLWVDFGKDMGMFHVGIYGMLTKWQYGGPYGWSINGELVRYKDVHDIVFGKRKGTIRLEGCQKNLRQCEIAWGNGGNSMLAYGMYHDGKPWAKKFADQIINAMLGLDGRGFLIPSGKLEGAWIGGYEALAKQFTDHYAGQQVFLPDQGYVNYFLGRCYLEGHNKDPRIVEAITRNCDKFLIPLIKRYGKKLPNALQPDGEPGYSREGVRYDFPNAPGILMAAISFAMLYQITGDKKRLEFCDKLLETHLAPLLAKFEFGFLEYDHHGYDSAGACLMLVGLAHYLEMKGGSKKALVRKMQEQVFYYLMSYRHEYDYFLPKHSSNTVRWGGVAVNKYGFVHGYSRNTSDGNYVLHIRWEYPYALLRTAQTSSIPLAKSALDNHYAYYSYQQFFNPKLEKGFGGVTEHTALSTYSQDTTHVIHSMPLGMLIMEEEAKGARSKKVGGKAKKPRKKA